MTRAKLAKTIFRKFVIFLVTWGLIMFFSLASLVLMSPTAASQSLISVEAEVRNLRSRIARVESEVRNLRSTTSRSNRSNRNARPRPVIVSPPNPNNRNQSEETEIQSSDPMFKRLATLVIELKEEVRAIDERLVTLEQNNS